jgi:hypothetical protein
VPFERLCQQVRIGLGREPHAVLAAASVGQVCARRHASGAVLERHLVAELAAAGGSAR